MTVKIHLENINVKWNIVYTILIVTDNIVLIDPIRVVLEQNPNYKVKLSTGFTKMGKCCL